MPVDIQTLIAVIPTAHDGDPIASNYHNSLRDVVVALASQPSGGPGPGLTFSLAPTFNATIGTNPPWVQGLGFATKPSAATAPTGSAEGWLQLDLPDGVRIDHLIFHGQRQGDMMAFLFRLLRQGVSESQNTPLATTPINANDADANGIFHVTMQGTPTSDTFKVDNINFKYYVHAQLLNAVASSVVNIFTIQLFCKSA